MATGKQKCSFFVCNMVVLFFPLHPICMRTPQEDRSFYDNKLTPVLKAAQAAVCTALAYQGQTTPIAIISLGKVPLEKHTEKLLTDMDL